jgi:hypothetical protein
MRRTQKFHTIVLQIELHIFFVHQNCGDEMFIEEQKGFLFFASITLLMELFINSLESKDKASFGRATSGSMKVT